MTTSLKFSAIALLSMVLMILLAQYVLRFPMVIVFLMLPFLCFAVMFHLVVRDRVILQEKLANAEEEIRKLKETQKGSSGQ